MTDFEVNTKDLFALYIYIIMYNFFVHIILVYMNINISAYINYIIAKHVYISNIRLIIILSLKTDFALYTC